MGLSFKIYSIATLILTTYSFYHLYQTESQLLGFTLNIANSKIYFCIALNFILMLTLLIGKILIYLFFEEVRLSELSEVTDKIKLKFFSLFIWFLSFRPSMDLSKIFLLVAYFLMAILTFISFKRSSYMVSLNEKSKKAQFKIVCVFIFLGICNYSFYHIYKISTNDNSLIKSSETIELIMYLIISNEFIFLFIMLTARFYKFIISITSINMGKVWEHRLIVFRLISLIKFFVKLCFEVDCLSKMSNSGVLPFYYIIDLLYNIWNLFRLILKIYNNYRTTLLINKLRDYSYDEEIKKLKLEDFDEEIRVKIKSEKSIICSICLSPIEIGKYLSCGHVFHLKCIKEWSIVNVNCPIDKSPLLVEENTKSKFLANQLGQHNNNNEGNNAMNANVEVTDEEILQNINLYKVTKGVYVPKTNPDLIKYSFFKKMKLMADNTNCIKKNSFIKSNEQSDQSGAMTYALPCEVIYNRGLENEINRLEKEILNKRIIDLYKNPFNAMNQYDEVLKPIKNKIN